MDRENAENLKKVYLSNIVAKLKDRKPLTDKELKHLKELSSSSEPSPQSATATDKGEGSPPEEEVGIPERLRIKRQYSLTEKAIEQRRKAAKGSKVNHWKHGKFAKTFLAKVRPCHRTCPYYPCEAVADGGTKPGGICLDKAAVISAYQAIVKAVEQKDYKDFNDLAALTIAESIHTVHMLLEDIVRDGTMAKREKWDKDGNVMSYEIVPHPSLLALPKLIADLGLTPSEFLITPRSIARADEEEKGAQTIADIMAGIGRKIKGQQEQREE